MKETHFLMKLMVISVIVIFTLLLVFGVLEFIIVMKYMNMPADEVPLWVLFLLLE